MARQAAAIILTLALLAGCGKEERKPPPPPTVMVATPLRQRVVDWDDYAGRFESLNAVELRPRVSGYLQGVNFRDGQRVQRGQLLFTIDPRPYQAVLNQVRAQSARARATLANAEVELRRSQALFEAKAGSQQDLEARRAAALQARADLASTDANVRLAALNVEFTRIRAPLTGRVSDRRVAPGNLVTADQTVLTTIVDGDPIRFSFEASEAMFLKRERGHRRRVGDTVRIRLADEPNYRWEGRLEFLDNQLDVNSGVIRGRAVVPNPDGVLTPGLYGHMRLPGSAPYDALMVPDDAIAAEQNRQIVYVVGPDNIVKLRPVEPGPLVGGLRVIRGGIAPTDRVIIGGLVRARPGAKVNAQAGRIRPARIVPADGYRPPASAAAGPV